jgi:hypothetical protein
MTCFGQTNGAFNLAYCQKNKFNPKGGSSLWRCRVHIGRKGWHYPVLHVWQNFQKNSIQFHVPLDAHVHVTMRYCKEVHQFTLSIDDNNKWIFVIWINAFVKLPLTLIPPLGYGMVFL